MRNVTVQLDNPQSVMHNISEEIIHMFTHRFHIHDEFIDVEFDGPYDKILWSLKRVELGPQHKAAVVGHGIDMRSAAESALRALLQTPFQEYKPELTHAVNEWLAGIDGVDVRQGDSIVRLYCIIKFVR